MIALLLIAQALPPVRAVEAPPHSTIRAPLPEITAEAQAEGPVLSLPEALDAARAQSPDLAVALERVRQAENNVQRAWSALQPTLNAVGTLTYNSVPSTIFTRHSGAGRAAGLRRDRGQQLEPRRLAAALLGRAQLPRLPRAGDARTTRWPSRG